MVLETIFSLIDKVMQLDMIIILVLAFIFIVVALKVFQYLFKLALVGVIFAALPIAAYFFGYIETISFSYILWSAFSGVMLYMAYNMLKTALKIIKAVFSPLKKVAKKKKKD